MKTSLVIVFLAAATSAAYAQQTTSVVDIAKPHSAKRHATHVITDDDIASSSAAAEPANGAARPETPVDAHTSTAAQPGPQVKLDDATLAAAKKFVQAKTVQIDAVNDEVKKLRDQLSHESRDVEVQSLLQSIDNLQHNLEVWSSQRKQAQDVIDATEKQKKTQDQKQPVVAASASDPTANPK